MIERTYPHRSPLHPPSNEERWAAVRELYRVTRPQEPFGNRVRVIGYNHDAIAPYVDWRHLTNNTSDTP